MRNLFAGVLVLYATFFWGSTFILVKATVQLLPINFFLLLRFLFSTLLMLPLIIYRWKLNNRLLWRQGIILGVLLFISYYFQTLGLVYTTPANAAFVTGLNVVFIPVLALLLFRRTLRRGEVIAVAISFLGTILITLNFTHLTINPGDLLILITAIAIAFHILFTEEFIADNIIELLWIQFLTMTVCAFLLTRVETQPTVVWYQQSVVIITLVVTVIFATIFAFAAQLYAQQSKISASVVGVLFSMEPVFALLIDLLVGTVPSIQTLGGMILILAAILLVSLLPPSDE